MPPKKRLGKKHRQAATRPKKGRSPRVAPTTGAIAPKKRKTLAARRAELEKKRRTPTRSPENETRRALSSSHGAPGPAPKKPSTPERRGAYANNLNLPEPNAEAADLHAWDQAEMVAVPSARRAGRSWAEIAARLGVTRQSAWEKWRQMDDGATGVLARAARARVEEVARSDTCAVPDVVGVGWDEARQVLHLARLVAVGPDQDGPPMAELAWRTGAVVVRQDPRPGTRLPAGAPVTIWLDRGGGAGDREPRRPRPTPRSGIELG